MKPEWRAWLDNNGAEWQDDRVVSYGNPVRELRVSTTGDILVDLGHEGLIEVHGRDALEFMQGQFTNDVRQVDAGHGQLSALCNPKGRVLAVFRLFRHDDTYYLRLPRGLVEPVLRRLRMFILRSQVTIEDASDAFVRFGYSGPDAEQELSDRVGRVPAAVDEVVQGPELLIQRVPGPMPRFEIYGELGPMQKLWEALNVRAAPVGAGPWELLDILAGIPEVYPETSEAFVPQMLNLHAVGGVSFRKGCYTGQEVVARMQYLGKLKRRMYRAHVEDAVEPRPGDPVVDPAAGGSQTVGQVVRAQEAPEGGHELLAVVEIAAHDRGELRLGEIDGPALEFRPLPYSLDPEQAAG